MGFGKTIRSAGWRSSILRSKAVIRPLQDVGRIALFDNRHSRGGLGSGAFAGCRCSCRGRCHGGRSRLQLYQAPAGYAPERACSGSRSAAGGDISASRLAAFCCLLMDGFWRRVDTFLLWRNGGCGRVGQGWRSRASRLNCGVACITRHLKAELSYAVSRSFVRRGGPAA